MKNIHELNYSNLDYLIICRIDETRFDYWNFFFKSISRYVVDYRVMTTSMTRIITQDRLNLDEDFADTLTILIITIKNKQIGRRM